MHKLFWFIGLMIVLPIGAQATVSSGAPAPAFSATDTQGEAVSLASLAGKTVVLEWTNHLCPFVKKHYGSGNMQRLQSQAKEAGVVWISVISSAPGKQGHVGAEEANEIAQQQGAVPTHIILDETGEIGRLYGAKTTPHMFVIASDGTLAYQGAIDDRTSPDPAEVEGAHNYVTAALQALAAGKTPEHPSTTPYGCSVKY